MLGVWILADGQADNAENQRQEKATTAAQGEKAQKYQVGIQQLLFEPCAGSTKPSPQPARLPCQDPGFDRSMPRAKDPLDLQRIPALPACVAMLMT